MLYKLLSYQLWLNSFAFCSTSKTIMFSLPMTPSLPSNSIHVRIYTNETLFYIWCACSRGLKIFIFFTEASDNTLTCWELLSVTITQQEDWMRHAYAHVIVQSFHMKWEILGNIRWHSYLCLVYGHCCSAL